MNNKIYLIPGMMCDKRLYKNIEYELADSYDLIYLKIPINPNIDELCEELYKKIKDEKINLLGFSLGAYIASYFAIKYPKKINKLFLISNSSRALNNEEIQKREFFLNNLSKFSIKELNTKEVKALISNKNDKDLISLIQNMYKDLGEENLISQLNLTINRKDLLKPLSKLSFPILFVYSLNDSLINKKWLEEICKKKNISSFVFYGSSHMLTLEKPKQITRLLIKFLSNT